jgi:hypothetical protein
MKPFFPWPKIPTFANYTDPLPELLIGSVKVHGTNAAVVLKDGKFSHTQSRFRVLSPAADNYSFDLWIRQKGRIKWIEEQYQELALEPNLPNGYFAVFGEFAGEGIQSKVGTAGVDRFFYLFYKNGLLADNDFCESKRIYSNAVIASLNTREGTQQALDYWTNKVENDCPVAAALGNPGIGEGLVWYSTEGKPLFKTKGKKHVYAPQNCQEIATNYPEVRAFVTVDRVQQAVEYWRELNYKIDFALIGKIAKYVMEDIQLEERVLTKKEKSVASNLIVTIYKSLITEKSS